MPQREGKQIITSGSSETINNGVGVVFIDPVSVLALFTLMMPDNPADRDEIIICAGGTIASPAAVVNGFAIQANTGQGLVGAGLATLLSGKSMVWIFRKDNAKWYWIA